MKAPELDTELPQLRLVEPNVARDAPLSLAWLQGEIGRNTLTMMGVPIRNNHESDLQHEKKRIAGFIENPGQMNWMLEYGGQVVGSIWVDQVDTEHLRSPALHIMIGDPRVRGRGVGTAASRAVIRYLKENDVPCVYSRHVTTNEDARKLLADLGFQPDGEPYYDKDGLNWQNVMMKLG